MLSFFINDKVKYMQQTKKGEKSPFNKTKSFINLYYKLKAIHNKDYSVVKTFGLPLVHNQEAFFLLYL